MRWRSADVWLFLLACGTVAAALTIGGRHGRAVEIALFAAVIAASLAGLWARRWEPRR